MPLYEYKCAVCGHRFDVRQGIREASLTECPECTGAIRRVVHPVGIVFKGSGFYKTDSRTTSEAAAPAGEKKTETAGDTGSNGSAEKVKEGAAAPAAKDGANTASTAAPAAPTSTAPSKATVGGKTD